jgi:hypothetical protein
VPQTTTRSAPDAQQRGHNRRPKRSAIHPRSAAGPEVGKAFTLMCRIETDLSDTVIVVHGGTTAGYALHLKEGRVVFAVRTGPKDALTEVRSEPIKWAVRITAALGKDGTMTLAVGAQAVATRKASGVVPRQPAEDFCLGHDNEQPVANYSKVKPFQGKITELKVTTP